MRDLEDTRILVVEDEALIADEIHDRLLRLGSTVVGVADSAAGAIEIAERTRPDVVLMDIRLKGGVDGIDAATQIYERFGIPGVFLTAYSDRDTIDRVRAAGRFSYLTKPFRESELALALSLAIRHHGMERGLRNSQRSLQSILATVADGVIAVDAEQRVRYINSAAEALVGMDVESAMGCRLDQVLRLKTEAGGEGPDARLEDALLRSGPEAPWRALFLLFRHDGQATLPIEVSVAPVRDDTVVVAAVTFRSISERRHAQSAHLRLAALIDSIPEPIFATDRSLRVAVVNRALLDRFGKRHEEVIGKQLSAIWTGGLLGEIDAEAAHVIRAGKPHKSPQRAWAAADGKLRWFEFSYMPLKDSTTMGLVCTIAETTERKALQHEVVEAVHREQQRIGYHLADGLGEDLSGLALLLKGLETNLARSASEHVGDTAHIRELLLRVIEDTRALARGLAPADDMQRGLAGALTDLAARCSELYVIDCSLVCSGAPPPKMKEAAAAHVYRIAQEALTNAGRHARAKEIKIGLHVSDGHLSLTISDDGIGLDQVPRKRDLGMGLRLMEYRAQALGGSIAFDRPNSGGTRIVLSAPLHLLRFTTRRGLRGEVPSADPFV
jgi:PAS domain S-box-containing protein